MNEEFIPSVNDETGPIWFDSVWEFFPNPIATQIKYNGYQSFWGMDWSRFPDLWPVFVFLFVFLTIRRIGYSFVFPHVASAMGIPRSSRSKTRKFCIQMWLATFYVIIASLNYFLVLRDAPFAGFPIREQHRRHVSNYYPDLHPDWNSKLLTWISCGFYMAELVTVFKDARRSDFKQYFLHHTVTVYLLLRAFLALEMKGGLYVVFLHDASDILLSVAKLAHYSKIRPIVVNILFGLFVMGFIFLRLVCFPVIISVRLFNSPRQRAAVTMYWVDNLGLITLQVLQVYWFILIVKMIVRLTRGVKGDVRSDESDDACGPPEPRSKLE